MQEKLENNRTDVWHFDDLCIGNHYILLTNNRRLLEGSTIFTPTIIKDYFRLKMHKFTVAPSLSSNGGWIVDTCEIHQR